MTLTRIPSLCLLSLGLAACVAANPENLGELESSSSGASDTDPSTTSPTSGMSSTTAEPTTDPSTTAQPTTDESESTRGETESESVSETQSETESETQSETETGEPSMCDGEQVEHFPAGCPESQAGVQLATQGCYEECTGLEDACERGRCTFMLVDPCPCANDPNLCCDACVGEQWLCVDEAGLGDCAAIAGRTFTSVEELECGLGPNGVELCNWSVAFGFDGTFTWMHSDVGEGGSYACADGVITVVDGPMVDVVYDDGNDQLTWDGVLYQ